MRLLSSSSAVLFSLLLTLPNAVSAVSLADFQPINGFSTACTKAYNTPMQDCTSEDFGTGNECSEKCISFLNTLTKLLNQQCKGTSALPSTLMGLFFIQQGTSTLCPNALDNSASDAHQPQSVGSQQQQSSNADSSDSSDANEQPTVVYVTPKIKTIVVTASKQRQTSGSVRQNEDDEHAAMTSSSHNGAQAHTQSGGLMTVTKASTASASETSSSTDDLAGGETTLTASPTASSSLSSSSTSSSPLPTRTNSSNNGGGGTILDLGASGSASVYHAGFDLRNMLPGLLIFATAYLWI